MNHDMDPKHVAPRLQMGAESIDIGPPAQAVFLRVEEDDFGNIYASFATADGDVFSLDEAALRLRMRWLAQQNLSDREEQLALKGLK